MKKEYMCYCGLYCENCAVMAKVAPAAAILYKEMRTAGFESFIGFMPNGTPFWEFLKYMADTGVCTSCKEGSGDPNCKIRACAKEKGVEMCALCAEYPCKLFDEMPGEYKQLKADNALLRDKGIEAWAKMQDERKASRVTIQEMK